jgi:hypothetical protein
MKRQMNLILALGCATVILTGCVAAIGNRDTGKNTTLGQQLVDLKKAKDAGALDETEYQEQRARLLNTDRRHARQ